MMPCKLNDQICNCRMVECRSKSDQVNINQNTRENLRNILTDLYTNARERPNVALWGRILRMKFVFVCFWSLITGGASGVWVGEASVFPIKDTREAKIAYSSGSIGINQHVGLSWTMIMNENLALIHDHKLTPFMSPWTMGGLWLCRWLKPIATSWH